MKKLFTILLSAIILTAACILPVCADGTVKTETDLRELVSGMLQREREPGEIVVTFKTGTTADEVKEVFSKAGISTDFDDKTVYLNNSLTEGGSDVWFVLNVTEERIFDVLVSLLSQDEKYGIKAVPNLILKADDPVTPLEYDVNLDNRVDAFDYQMLKAAILGVYELNDVQKEIADINGSGSIDAFDYQLLKWKLLNVPEEHAS